MLAVTARGPIARAESRAHTLASAHIMMIIYSCLHAYTQTCIPTDSHINMRAHMYNKCTPAARCARRRFVPRLNSKANTQECLRPSWRGGEFIKEEEDLFVFNYSIKGGTQGAGLRAEEENGKIVVQHPEVVYHVSGLWCLWLITLHTGASGTLQLLLHSLHSLTHTGASAHMRF